MQTNVQASPLQMACMVSAAATTGPAHGRWPDARAVFLAEAAGHDQGRQSFHCMSCCRRYPCHRPCSLIGLPSRCCACTAAGSNCSSMHALHHFAFDVAGAHLVHFQCLHSTVTGRQAEAAGGHQPHPAAEGGFQGLRRLQRQACVTQAA